MAFDAGSVIAHLDVELDRAKGKIDQFEHDLDRLGRDRTVRIGAVFDQGDISKARRMFADLDRQISRDAAQRMRADPNGSVFGSLNALLSPHQIAGAPTAQQAARNGMLGRVFTAQVSDATRQSARQNATAVADDIANAAAREAVGKAASDTATELRRRRFSLGGILGTSAARLAGINPGDAKGNFVTGLLGGIGPGILGIGGRFAGLAALGSAGLGALPALLGPLAALGVLGAGAGIIKLGAGQLIGSKNVPGQAPTEGPLFAAAQNAKNAISSAFQSGAKTLIGPLREAFDFLPKAIRSLTPELRGLFAGAGTLLMPLLHGLITIARDVLPGLGQAFRAVAPLIQPLLGGFGSLVKGLFPGLIMLLKDAMPAVRVFGQALGSIGRSLSGLFSAFAPVMRQSSVIIKAIFGLITPLLPIIGQLAGIMARALAPAFSAFAGVIRGLEPVLVLVGKVLAEFSKAVFLDLVSAFKAVAALIHAIQPGLHALLSILGAVFQTLENTGFFAVLGNVLEALAKPLGTLVNALLRGLAPILGVVVKLVSDLSGTIVNLLGSALIALLPVVIRLVNVLLGALGPVLPPIEKAIASVANSLGKLLLASIVAEIPQLDKFVHSLDQLIVAILPILPPMATLTALVIKLAVNAIVPLIPELVRLGSFMNIVLLKVSDIITAIIKVIATIVQWASHLSNFEHLWNDIWGAIKTTATDFSNWFIHVFADDIGGFFTRTLPGWLTSAVSFISDNFVQPVEGAFGTLWRWISGIFGNDIGGFFTRTIPGILSRGVQILSSAWGDVEGAIKGPVDWVITHVINDGLIGAFDFISKAVGGPHIDPIPGFRRGGRLAGFGGGDIQPALLEPGETVIDKEKTRQYAWLFRLMGVPGFQGGGLFGKLLDTGKIIAAVATGNGTALTNAFLKLFGISSGGAVGDMASLLVDIPHRLVSEAVHFLIGQFAGSAGGGVPGNVSSYRGLVLRVLGMLGQPSADLGVALRQMSTESGGSPDVVNKWDSNWLAGHPSVGLMQVIRGTFDAFAGPFRNVGPFLYGVSTNPLANIFAGLNYAIHRYGAGWTSVLGQGHGYDSGGWMRSGGWGYNLTGGREAVLTPGQSEAFVSMAQLAEYWRKGGGGGGGGMRDVYLMLPEGSTVSDALAELDFQLKANRLSGAVP